MIYETMSNDKKLKIKNKKNDNDNNNYQRNDAD